VSSPGAARAHTGAAHLALIPPGASPQEAAAIVAALAQFARDGAHAPTASAPAREGWREAALQEAVERAPEDLFPDPWINT
jgi:hypothetical protein